MLTIGDGARALFKVTNLDDNLWPEMVRIKIHLLNRSPTNALKGITPFEAWNDYKPDLSHLRVVGSMGYKTTARDTLKKLDDRAEKCVLLGYGGTNQYRVFNLVKKRVELVRDVRFQEADHRPSEKIVPDISAKHEAPEGTGRSLEDDPRKPTLNHGQKRSLDEDPGHDGPPSKRTRSQVPYLHTLFADCQQSPEQHDVLGDI